MANLPGASHCVRAVSATVPAARLVRRPHLASPPARPRPVGAGPLAPAAARRLGRLLVLPPILLLLLPLLPAAVGHPVLWGVVPDLPGPGPGDEVSIGASAYNTGAIIAHGKSEALDLVPVPSEHYLPQQDGSHVYEFKVPLDIRMDTIPREEAYNVRVDVHMEVPGCDEDADAALMSSNVRVHTSPELRPRMDLTIMNPLKIIYVHPQFVGDSLYIHTGFNSPWGNYDVDERPGGVVVEIAGPSPATNLVRAAVVQRVHEHGHHFEPVDMTYGWPFVLDQAQHGPYHITVTAHNDQQTAQAVARATFELGPNTAVDAEGNPVFPAPRGDDRGVPAAGALAGLALLAAAAVVARRLE